MIRNYLPAAVILATLLACKSQPPAKDKKSEAGKSAATTTERECLRGLWNGDSHALRERAAQPVSWRDPAVSKESDKQLRLKLLGQPRGHLSRAGLGVLGAELEHAVPRLAATLFSLGQSSPGAP